MGSCTLWDEGWSPKRPSHDLKLRNCEPHPPSFRKGKTGDWVHDWSSPMWWILHKTLKSMEFRELPDCWTHGDTVRVEVAARAREYCASSPITCPKHPFHLNVHSFIVLFYYELVNVGGFRVLANYQIIRRVSWELQLIASHSEANSLGLATGIWSRAPMGLSPYPMGSEANSL